MMTKLFCCCAEAAKGCELICQRWSGKKKPDVVCSVLGWPKYPIYMRSAPITISDYTFKLPTNEDDE